MNRNIKWIKCGKHQKRRWQIVCIHLFKDPCQEWLPLPQNEKVGALDDYLCHKCMDTLIKTEDEWSIFKDIRPCCVNCVDEVRKVFDKNYAIDNG